MNVPIEHGARGAAVEDVQQRLLRLGYELGSSGVDGVFLGETYEAVRSFQHERGLAEDGAVGPETWAALVDATFTLGDRLLYLRLPYFHGADVRTLQGALNVLGFACGGPDAIFGAYTERAVREFQANTGQPADGIVGADTVRSVLRLRHVWADKDPALPVSLVLAPARAAEVLARTRIAVVARDARAAAIADRFENLARATEPSARVHVTSESGDPDADVVLDLGEFTPGSAPAGVPFVRVAEGGEDAVEARVFTALLGARRRPRATVDLADVPTDERGDQRLAVRLLDAVCSALG
ncbi:MAG TPA: peptidoglycan-binding protein [Coriobacteriia bacterium]|nr:peptidoglycan-binding protein [Coriobacteriia bacterium]